VVWLEILVLLLSLFKACHRLGKYGDLHLQGFEVKHFDLY